MVFRNSHVFHILFSGKYCHKNNYWIQLAITQKSFENCLYLLNELQISLFISYIFLPKFILIHILISLATVYFSPKKEKSKNNPVLLVAIFMRYYHLFSPLLSITGLFFQIHFPFNFVFICFLLTFLKHCLSLILCQVLKLGFHPAGSH